MNQKGLLHKNNRTITTERLQPNCSQTLIQTLDLNQGYNQWAAMIAQFDLKQIDN